MAGLQHVKLMIIIYDNYSKLRQFVFQCDWQDEQLVVIYTVFNATRNEDNQRTQHLMQVFFKDINTFRINNCIF